MTGDEAAAAKRLRDVRREAVRRGEVLEHPALVDQVQHNTEMIAQHQIMLDQLDVMMRGTIDAAGLAPGTPRERHLKLVRGDQETG